MSPPELLSIEKSGDVGTIWLNRPDKYNALSTELWSIIPGALDSLSRDGTTKAIIIAGRGKHFCVGIDLFDGLMATKTSSEAPSEAVSNLNQLEGARRFQRAISSIAECPLPVIAVVHGHCLGAGIDLISACDIRLCSSDANFSVRETRIGLVADVGTLQRLPHILNAGHVAELAYTGKDIGSKRAEKIGLVNDVYGSFEDAYKGAMEIASDIASNSTLAVKGTKFILQQSENLTTEQSLMLNGMYTLMTSMKSNDLKESMAAFLSKRPAKFTGT
ncbi:MAG: enoyl-CoA hydratase [Candidatus Endolissoclinum sp. TMED37]|nr:MAG: enoyl-CoA hydratase [Candidatus Endolissoclinum sp. TMED37]OUU20869.1 MAG: enoyl-CoA hydratase [Candidatus Endolissoclinum sp. TMED37]|tara:strand:+ start:12952 stop:13776 length:825 start_codon:yes stop_codon:yes gene_type:complete